MKKMIVIALTIFWGSQTIAFAQDMITTREGADIEGRVIEIGLTEVKYQAQQDSATGAVSSIPKENVLLIRYADGGKEIFENMPAPVINQMPAGNARSAPAPAGSSLFFQGQMDAKRYYRGYRTAGTVSFISGMLLGLLPGVAVPAIFASSTPEISRSEVPRPNLLTNTQYLSGYTTEAKSIKSKKSWNNYLYGVLTQVVVYAGILVLVLLAL